MIEHLIHVASSRPRGSTIDCLTHYIMKFTKMNPSVSSQAFRDKLFLMEKNLVRSLGKASTDQQTKTWPRLPELIFLQLIGKIWSTSDMRHPVVGPARILMGAYLGLGRIKDMKDLCAGLFLCTLFLTVSPSR